MSGWAGCRHSAALAVIAVLMNSVSAGAVEAPATSVSSEVSTIAGSGAVAMQDGDALRASFLTLGALARGQDGTVYIVDELAERIRALGPDHKVRTVAGSGPLGLHGLSVVGGFRDGPALESQFNHPTGIAVAPDGSIYVADSKNACIRRIYRGIVSTVVGRPGEARAVDGPAEQARLVSPRSLSFDSKGTLWIADYGGGLRRLDASGLTTIKLKSYGDPNLWSVSASPDPKESLVLAASAQLVFIYDSALNTDSYVSTGLLAEGEKPFGNPNQIVAIGGRQALFTDMVSNNVRYLRLPTSLYNTTVFTRAIAGGTLERGIDNAGFADGSRVAARFYSPRGLLVEGESALVGDAGNHRLRLLKLPRFRSPEAGLSDEYKYDNAHYEIAYISASTAFWDSLGDDSICAQLEARLNSSGRLGKPVRCHAIRIDGANMQRIDAYIDDYLAFRKIDTLIIAADPSSVPSDAPGAWTLQATQAAWASLMEDVVKVVKPPGTRVVLFWQFNSFAFSDDEDLSQHDTILRSGPDEVDVLQAAQAVSAALKDLPVAIFNSFDAFAKYEKTAGHLPLYGNPDTHTNPRGNAFIAARLAEFLTDNRAAAPR
jgi:DNA-binding beta-propeller fold protein YncE